MKRSYAFKKLQLTKSTTWAHFEKSSVGSTSANRVAVWLQAEWSSLGLLFQFWEYTVGECPALTLKQRKYRCFSCWLQAEWSSHGLLFQFRECTVGECPALTLKQRKYRCFSCWLQAEWSGPGLLFQFWECTVGECPALTLKQRKYRCFSCWLQAGWSSPRLVSVLGVHCRRMSNIDTEKESYRCCSCVLLV